MKQAPIFRHAFINFLATGFCIILFSFSHLQLFTFAPLLITAIMLISCPLPCTLGILLVYIAFDGMLKILSGYNPLVHVGPDLLVVLLVTRWLLLISLGMKPSKLGAPPFWTLFVVHVAWVTVEILNPYGLGLIPGIAAYKVYASFLSLYFLSYMSLNDPKELKSLIQVAVFIMVFEIVLSIYQFNQGVPGLLALSRNYLKPISFGTFTGIFFRPFGTSTGPGAVSTWLFLTAPLAMALFAVTEGTLKKFLFLPITLGVIYVLFIAQVRSASFKAALGIAVAFMLLYWKQPKKLVWGLIVSLFLGMAFQSLFLIDDPMLKAAKDRYEALSNLEYVRSARGQGVWDAVSYIWENAPFGIGLSRVGAAASVFEADISKNPFYGTEWMFADNLYRAITVELGIPGSIFYLALIFVPLLYLSWRLIRIPKGTDTRVLVGGCIGLGFASVLGHWGSEGCLYLPECAYFWMFIGAAIRFSGPQDMSSSPCETQK